MKYKVRLYEIETGKPIVVLNDEDVAEMGIHVGDRVKIIKGSKAVTGIVDTTTSFVNPDEIGIFEEVKECLDVKDGDTVEVKSTVRPKSVEFLKKKLKGEELHGHEIRTIIQDIVDNNLSDIELSAFVTASYINGYTMDEIVALTNSMVETGDTFDFGDDTVDKHCIGGVAGNRTTMILVPIVAAAGLTIPKTSSRAITSPAGTADTMEFLANVEFDIEELKKIVAKTNGCIVWGGAVNLAPADDKIIRAEYPLSIDPEGQVLASVMAKKKSVGSDYVVIDIPVGKGTKIEDMDQANLLARKFIELGNRLEISTECIVTDGSAPIGNGIGPALEARDVLDVLNGKGPTDLANKSVDLAGVLLELSGKVRKGEGRKTAESILESGKAKKKMMEIIEAQGGNPRIKSSDIQLGDKTYEVLSDIKGRVKFIDNSLISKVARAAGAPKNKGAGILLHVGVGDKIEKNQKLFTIYSEVEDKLDYAIKTNEQLIPIRVGGVILKSVVK
ncbi:MAG: AMP phosphorylase [Candidatus Altiarchaeota archaeon]